MTAIGSFLNLNCSFSKIEKYSQKKFQYTDEQQPLTENLFELQPTISLLKDTTKLEVDMNDQGTVMKVSNVSVFLYTDYLGPCVAAIGKCKIANSSMLIGVTHLYSEDEDLSPSLATEINNIIINNIIKINSFNKEKIIEEGQFKKQKLNEFINQFSRHPSYHGETIELFFAGGNGSIYNKFWRELTVEYAKSIPQVEVIGTYFNPYQATEEIRKKINSKNLELSFLAGITNQGSILLHKSHAIDFNFQTSNFDALLSSSGDLTKLQVNS